MEALTPTRPIRVLQITDPHLFQERGQRLLNVDTDASLRGVLDHITRHESSIDAILATGDLSQDGSSDAYQRFLDLTLPLCKLLRGLPGNHDFNEAFYTVMGNHAQAVTDIGCWRIVMLDSSIPRSAAGHLAADQLNVLRQAIDTADERHILVAVHHNPVPIGSRWLDSMMIDNGHELLALLQQSPSVQGLIWGHVHQEFDSLYNFGTLPPDAADARHKKAEPGDQDHHDSAANGSGRRHLRLLATPATCVQFTPQSVEFSLDTVDPGYRWIELHDDGRIDTAVVRVPGLGIKPDTDSAGY